MADFTDHVFDANPDALALPYPDPPVTRQDVEFSFPTSVADMTVARRYAQRIYDTAQAKWVYYTTVGLTKTPPQSDTRPVHAYSHNLDPASHEVLYEIPATDAAKASDVGYLRDALAATTPAGTVTTQLATKADASALAAVVATVAALSASCTAEFNNAWTPIADLNFAAQGAQAFTIGRNVIAGASMHTRAFGKFATLANVSGQGLRMNVTQELAGSEGGHLHQFNAEAPPSIWIPLSQWASWDRTRETLAILHFDDNPGHNFGTDVSVGLVWGALPSPIAGELDSWSTGDMVFTSWAHYPQFGGGSLLSATNGTSGGGSTDGFADPTLTELDPGALVIALSRLQSEGRHYLGPTTAITNPGELVEYLNTFGGSAATRTRAASLGVAIALTGFNVDYPADVTIKRIRIMQR